VETILGRRLLPRWKLFGDTVNTAARCASISSSGSSGAAVSRATATSHAHARSARMKAYSTSDRVLASEATVVAAMGGQAPAFGDVVVDTRVVWPSNPGVAITARPRMEIKGKGRMLTFWVSKVGNAPGSLGALVQNPGSFRVRVSVMVPLEQFAHTPRREEPVLSDSPLRTTAAEMVASTVVTPVRLPGASQVAPECGGATPKRVAPSRHRAALDAGVETPRVDGVSRASHVSRGRSSEGHALLSVRAHDTAAAPFRRPTTLAATGAGSEKARHSRPRRNLRAHIDDFVSEMCAQELNKVIRALLACCCCCCARAKCGSRGV
jgi:hypothetical protein